VGVSSSDSRHKQVDARVDLQVLEALYFSFDTHEQASKADEDGTKMKAISKVRKHDKLK